MTETETAKLSYMITSAYPGKGPKGQDELDGYLYSLRMVLEEIPFKVAEAAVRKCDKVYYEMFSNTVS